MPVITLTTDFGLTDSYVAQMKAAILRRAPGVTIVDVTHQIPRHDILAGSIAIERAVANFGERTVHVGVVDPGVGGPRKLLACQAAGQWVLCPDNALITWTLRRHGGRCFELPVDDDPTVSAVFHGRDILAPAATVLAADPGATRLLGSSIEPVLLEIDCAPVAAGTAWVIHVDHFGNCTTNLPAEHLPPGVRMVQAGQHAVGPIRRTYCDVPPGQPLALIGSSRLLEIAVREGSAADQLGLRVGSVVTLR